MADLCSKCANFEKCIEEGTANDCVDNDYISYSPKGRTCEGCFYEDWPKELSMLSPCFICIRQPVSERIDNYISKENERETCND